MRTPGLTSVIQPDFLIPFSRIKLSVQVSVVEKFGEMENNPPKFETTDEVDCALDSNDVHNNIIKVNDNFA